MVSSRERRQYDFYVCYDEDEKKASLHVAESLTMALEKAGLVGQYKQRECPPGTQVDQYHRSACMESDMVICLIGKVHLKTRARVHVDNIMSAIKIKRDQGTGDHIIPVIYNLKSEKVARLIKGSVSKTPASLVPMLELSEYISVKDQQWKEKIMAVFEQLPAGENC